MYKCYKYGHNYNLTKTMFLEKHGFLSETSIYPYTSSNRAQREWHFFWWAQSNESSLCFLILSLSYPSFTRTSSGVKTAWTVVALSSSRRVVICSTISARTRTTVHFTRPLEA